MLLRINFGWTPKSVALLYIRADWFWLDLTDFSRTCAGSALQVLSRPQYIPMLLPYLNIDGLRHAMLSYVAKVGTPKSSAAEPSGLC
jgi:hypothetical protein